MNLWLGAFTAIFSTIVLILSALVPPIIINPAVVSGVTLAAGALMALVANQPPTLTAGDTFNVQTPKGQPNYTTTVAAPPNADRPPIRNDT